MIYLTSFLDQSITKYILFDFENRSNAGNVDKNEPALCQRENTELVQGHRWARPACAVGPDSTRATRKKRWWTQPPWRPPYSEFLPTAVSCPPSLRSTCPSEIQSWIDQYLPMIANPFDLILIIEQFQTWIGPCGSALRTRTVFCRIVWPKLDHLFSASLSAETSISSPRKIVFTLSLGAWQSLCVGLIPFKGVCRTY